MFSFDSHFACLFFVPMAVLTMLSVVIFAARDLGIIGAVLSSLWAGMTAIFGLFIALGRIWEPLSSERWGLTAQILLWFFAGQFMIWLIIGLRFLPRLRRRPRPVARGFPIEPTQSKDAPP